MSVSLIFGQNLRRLIQERSSIARIADELQISRVQAQRYLKGESFPKPPMLKRICDLFGVDARIMTERLPQDGRGFCNNQTAVAVGPKLAPLLHAVAYAAAVQDYMPQASVLEDGAYIGWSNSLAYPGMVTRNIYLVKTTGGMRTTRTIDPLDLFPAVKLGRKDVAWRSPRLREARGAVLSSQEGVSLFMFCQPPGQWVSMLFLSPEPSSNGNLFSGVELFGRKEYAGVQRVARIVWMRLPPVFSVLMRAARTPTWQPMDAVPDYIAKVLRQPVG